MKTGGITSSTTPPANFEILASQIVEKLDAEMSRIGISMMRVNQELSSHLSLGSANPRRTISLARRIRKEEIFQKECVSRVGHLLGDLSRLREEVGSCQKLSDSDAPPVLETLALKMAEVDYDLKCRSAGMSSALQFPKKWVRGEKARLARHTARHAARKMPSAIRRICLSALGWDVIIALAVLVIPWSGAGPVGFWNMIAAGGVLLSFSLYSLTMSLSAKK